LLSRDDKLGLAGHLGVNVGSLLLGLPPVSGVPELLVALGRWHGRTIPEDREAALRAAAETLGVAERDVLNAELLLDHAGIDLDWIAHHAHGRPGGIEGEVDHLLAHVRAEAAHPERGLSGWKFDHADYEPAFRAIALTYRRLFAQPGFLDAMRHELGRASAARERDIRAIVRRIEERHAQQLDAEREEKQRLLTLVETLVGRAQARPEDELAAVLARVRAGGEPAALTAELARAAAKAEVRWPEQAEAPASARADTLRAYRELATLAYWTDTTRALAAWRKVAELDRSDLRAPIEVGRLERRKGDLAAAAAAFDEAEARAERARDRYQLGLAAEGQGYVLVAQGKLDEALAAYERRHRIISDLAAGDPSNAEWQRDLSVSHNKIGDVRVARGDLGGALEAYEAGLAIRERLAAGDRSNTEWQRDLIVSNVKLAEVATAQDDAATAAGRYRAALAVAEGLAEDGRLAPRDAGLPEELRRRLAALGG
jgi:tetratricopeptide (TPR) repeat protein